MARDSGKNVSIIKKRSINSSSIFRTKLGNRTMLIIILGGYRILGIDELSGLVMLYYSLHCISHVLSKP